jgi:DNA sulfur modification protein DndE
MTSIKTSEENKERVQSLTNKLGLVRNENIIARVAFSFSITKGRKLHLSTDLKDSKGKEYKEDTLFGDKKSIYLAMVCQYYQIYKSNPDIYKYVKMHIDDGLEQMESFLNSNPNLDVLEFIIQQVERGIESIESSSVGFGAVSNNNPLSSEKMGYGNLIELEVGKDKNGKPIIVPINDTKFYNNSHIAIAGQSGSGKTQFALDILSQIARNSNGSTNFIYLDFKGLNSEDEKKLQSFFNITKTTLINAPLNQFPLNPLGFIDNINETNKKMGIKRFADIIASYHEAGSSRVLQLKDAIKTAFGNQKSGQYPTLNHIYEELKSISGTSQNKIINVLDGLTDPPVFQDELNKNFLNQNYYLSLAGTLAEDVRFTAIFMTINYIFQQFMTMPDAPLENGVRTIRYVLLIDEAQILFREPSVRESLQVILEQIRSKGVSVILVAQNIKEFYTPTFNFSSLCEITFLLNIKEKTNQKQINSFLGYSDAEGKKLIKSLENIETGQAVSNVKQFKKAELFDVTQFWKRK